MLHAAVESGVSAAEPVDYDREVQPLLVEHCFKCHNDKKQQGDLRLDSRAAILHGGNTGPALVPGKSGESLLIEAITGGPNASAMPPKGPKLSTVEIALLKRWIDAGAPGPSVEKAAATAIRKSDHWAFQPVRRLAVPEKPAPEASGRREAGLARQSTVSSSPATRNGRIKTLRPKPTAARSSAACRSI